MKTKLRTTAGEEFNENEKKIIVRESRTTATTRKIETINNIERYKHLNSISYQLSEISLPALQKSSHFHTGLENVDYSN